MAVTTCEKEIKISCFYSEVNLISHGLRRVKSRLELETDQNEKSHRHQSPHSSKINFNKINSFLFHDLSNEQRGEEEPSKDEEDVNTGITTSKPFKFAVEEDHCNGCNSSNSIYRRSI